MFHDLRTDLAPFAVAALICGALTVPAFAGRLSYVSSTGSDANACTLAAPCRTLKHAIAVTVAGGEVHLVDSGGYGAAITIGKAITISGDGATLFAAQILIKDTGVTLRGLVLNGGGTPAGSNAVVIEGASLVHIERCTIQGFSGAGILLEGGRVSVTDSTVHDNIIGLAVNLGFQVTVAGSHFDNNKNGLGLSEGKVVIDHSSASGNGEIGIAISGGADVTVTSTTVSGNFGVGLSVSSGSTARISNSVLTGNATGIANSGNVLTRQNNTVSGNTNDLTGNALTPLGGV